MRRAAAGAGLFLWVAAAACGRGVSPAAVPPPVPADPARRLVLWAEARPDEGPAPLEVEFSCESLVPDEEPAGFHWDFGDGSPPARTGRPRHTYARPGMYVARVVAWDGAGQVGEDTVRIDVEAPRQ